MQKKPNKYIKPENSTPVYLVAAIVIILYCLAFSAIGSCSEAHRAEIAGECR
jgi:hypothetical protein